MTLYCHKMTLDTICDNNLVISYQLCDSDQEPATMRILLGVLSHWVDGGSPFQGETFLLITTLMMTTRAMMISMSTSTSKWSFITSLSFCKNENDICATGHWQVGVFVWAEPGGLQRAWGQHGLWWGAYGPGENGLQIQRHWKDTDRWGICRSISRLSTTRSSTRALTLRHPTHIR